MLKLPETLAARTIVTIATQRSGTKAFAQSLNSGELVRSAYEIFLPNNPAGSITRAFVAHLGKNPDFAFSPEELNAFLDEFFTTLHGSTDRDWLHFDVMYDNLGVLSTLWTYPIGLPWRNFLMGYFRSRGFLVLHLVREDILECFASNIIAQTRNLYHTDKDIGGQEEAPITLDPERALHYVMPVMRTRELVREAFRPSKRCIELTYPHFIDGDRIAEAAVQKIAAAMGLSAEDAARLFGPIRMRPTAPDKRRLISNYDEVAAHLAPSLAKLAEPRGPRW
ncbi:hypothetical protein KPL78_12210 [Roseomonas sp. HJA6]|uniref:Sulfotransferase family protein n=1 Tax=Roseomonas alba TaxID=2846776 RepID=A0ABS7A8H9_9PROT|nr:hypothetical protein [Neoroseomonas alba]MBW6398619.1 hypothetical protein [Neoroseomonas alba]